VKDKIKSIMIWLVLGLIVVYLAFEHFAGRPKTGFIIIQDIYSQFEMKKELQKKYESAHNTRKRIADSMVMSIRMLGQKIDAEKGKDTSDISHFKAMRMDYYERKQRSDQDDSAQSKQYDDAILNQLNQYVKDYGKENHYEYIFGNGNGSLMDADESKNITAQVTQYVNQRYEGKK
jgi:outer membrane protein